MDLVKHRHRQDPTDSRDRLQAKERLGVVDLGVLLEVQFKLADRSGRRVGQQFEVQFDRRLDARIFKALSDTNSIGFVADLFGKRERGCAGG